METEPQLAEKEPWYYGTQVLERIRQRYFPRWRWSDFLTHVQTNREYAYRSSYTAYVFWREILRALPSGKQKSFYLSRCRFCNARGLWADLITERQADKKFKWYVECTKCQCRGPLAVSQKDAAMAWNQVHRPRFRQSVLD